jgi:pSer/pThr/pTyr-binding forkhead associated (FHA) protein
MGLSLDVFLLILRLLLIVLLYLFLMQVVIAITRDLRKTSSVSADSSIKAQPVAAGHLVLVDCGPSTTLVPGTRFDLVAPQTTIGRSPVSTIRLTDAFISNDHARIWNRDGSWFVQDVGSTYGTYVNRQPASKPLPARSGDIVQLGPIQFQLKVAQ